MIYVMSDLHGQYKLYQAMLKKINFTEADTLYILGDVIDRGEKPIEILLDMMDRPNIKPLLGNHDDRMLEALSKTELTSFEDAMNLKDSNHLINTWVYDGGTTTIKEYCGLSTDVQKQVLDYLKTFKLYETLKVGEKKFFLSHTAPAKANMRDLDGLTVDDFTWGDIQYDKQYFENGYLVTGHTPTALIDPDCRGRIYKKNGHIAMDCGAFFTGFLGCICLDTFEEFYVNRWDGYSFESVVTELTGLDNFSMDQPLYQVLGVNPKRFSRVPFSNMQLSTRAFRCLNRYLNSPFASCEPGFVPRDMISNLLEMSLNDYINVRNLGLRAFAEVLEKLVYITTGKISF